MVTTKNEGLELPWQIQDDLDRITAEGSTGPADPTDYRITGGSGNWTIEWSDGTQAQTNVRNPLSAANDARLLANAFANRQIKEEVKPTTTKPTTTGPTTAGPTTTTRTVDTTPATAVDTSVAGGAFTPTQPPTDVLELGAGQVAPIDPNVSQTVRQQVKPTGYMPQLETGIQTQLPETGTVSTPLQTSGFSALPSEVTYKTQYAGTQGAVPQTLVTTAPGMGVTYDQSQLGYQTVTYGNQVGQRIPVTEFNGAPTTYVPPGFMRLSELQAQQQALTSQAPEGTAAAKGGLMHNGYAEGGDITNKALLAVAKLNGYNGTEDSRAVRAFMNSSEGLRAKARAVGVAMNKGGAVLYAQEGVDVQPGSSTDPTFAQNLAEMTKSTISQTMQPQQAPTAMIQPTAAEFIPVDAGMATPIAPFAEAATVGTVQQAQLPTTVAPAVAGVTTAAPQVQAETAALQAAQGQVAPEAQVTAAQQATTSVSGMEAAQGTATMVNAPAAREIQAGELIDGVADAEKAATFNEQIQAATATPTKQATVAGQLETLMAQFEGGNTPPWAAGSMRTAMATLSARGLGASSMAGQAVIQATMEAALPIAQMDAQTMAQFESMNLSNRQQRALLAAQQRATFLGMEFDQAFQARVANSARIGDVANMNFTAEQNIALENSRAANTMNLNNLSNRQAMVMAEAAALSQLDMANLNNRQQAAVQNAQNFLQMDMANLSNEQQTAVFKAQQNIQALFTDQAATNAAAQFNAQSENQTNQFFANLSNQTSQFNATQQNAMDQFNVNSVNALREFNSEIQQQRDLFNAQNGLVIAQANAQWRQNIATINTATQNQSNMDFAKTMNAFTSTNLDAYWQRERDIMSFAFTSAENAADRMASVLLEKMSAESKQAYADAAGQGTLTAVLLKGALNYMAGDLGNIV